jgi:ABC-type multidrug transport system, ATPase and permease components
MSGYTGLVDVTVYSLIPTITSVICTVAALAPVVPTFTVILVGIMVVYIAFVWLMYKRIMPLSAATSAAQNKLSGVLSDAVTNILAVKTCGREDFERDLFDAADRAARDAETVSMHAMMQRNFTTSGSYRHHHGRGECVRGGRQRVVWHLGRLARHDLYLYL